jgi:exopolysaccharide production protein ExoZ
VLRGVAACGVVVHHAYRFVDPDSFVRVGAAGVDLFFVISGFIMATIGPGRRPGEFIADRMWRIFPMWLMCVVPWLLVFPHNWPTTLTSLTLWPVWGGGFHMPAVLRGWTLCFEMLFYFTFALGLATRSLIPPVALFLLCFAAGPHNAFLWFAGSPLILEFLAGALIAQLPLARHGGLFILAALAWFAAAPVTYYEALGGYEALLRVISWGIPAALLVYGARSMEERFAGSRFDLPVLIGNASFSIYLFHRIAVTGCLPWPVELIAGIAVGVGVYWFIERRVMRAKPRFHVRQESGVGLRV